MINQAIIDEVKQRLINVFDPLEIYLFGSYAWGLPEEDSDLDVLVVVEKSDKNQIERMRIGYRALLDIDIPNDLLVYTKEEFDERANDIRTFLYKIKQKGKRIYVRV